MFTGEIIVQRAHCHPCFQGDRTGGQSRPAVALPYPNIAVENRRRWPVRRRSPISRPSDQDTQRRLGPGRGDTPIQPGTAGLYRSGERRAPALDAGDRAHQPRSGTGAGRILDKRRYQSARWARRDPRMSVYRGCTCSASRMDMWVWLADIEQVANLILGLSGARR